MRSMWQRWGRDFYAQPPERRGGLAEDGFPALLAEASGVKLDREIRDWTEGTGELPLAPLLRQHGIGLEARGADQAGATIGARLAMRDGQLQCASVLNGGPAHAAGLSAGDAIVAVDGLRIADERALKALLERRGIGARLRVHAFRRDELHELELVPAPATPTEAVLGIDPKASVAARRLLQAWLTGSTGRPKRP
jgi:predicted metalloprotease with PDZ domain